MPLEISDDLKKQKNKLEQKDPWVYLFELELDEGWYRITNHVELVHWNGSDWNPFPLAISELRMSSKGEVPTAQISVGNAGGLLMDYLRQNMGLAGKQGNIYLVNLDFLDDPIYSVIPEKFSIVGASAKNDVVIFGLSLMADAYGIEGPLESYDREKFPALPILQPKFSTGMI